MGNAIIKFCAGKTDFNQNGVADNQELFALITTLIAKLEENIQAQENKWVYDAEGGLRPVD